MFKDSYSPSSFKSTVLPHIHLLIFLKQRFKIRDAAHVNSIVSAQIPDPVAHPTLYATVTKCMMHGSLVARQTKSTCMVDGNAASTIQSLLFHNPLW